MFIGRCSWELSGRNYNEIQKSHKLQAKPRGGEKRLGPATTLYEPSPSPLSSRAKPRDLQFLGPFVEMFFDRAHPDFLPRSTEHRRAFETPTPSKTLALPIARKSSLTKSAEALNTNIV
jgi:hypothetical protein